MTNKEWEEFFHLMGKVVDGEVGEYPEGVRRKSNFEKRAEVEKKARENNRDVKLEVFVSWFQD